MFWSEIATQLGNRNAVTRLPKRNVDYIPSLTDLGQKRPARRPSQWVVFSMVVTNLAFLPR